MTESGDDTIARPDDPPPRPLCPACGSPHTQPFAHAGPAARVNMQCVDCGTLFKHRRVDPERTR
jgi:hypothetical protein